MAIEWEYHRHVNQQIPTIYHLAPKIDLQGGPLGKLVYNKANDGSWPKTLGAKRHVNSGYGM